MLYYIRAVKPKNELRKDKIMKKITTLLVCAAMLCCFAACAEKPEIPKIDDIVGGVQIPNPFTEVDTMDAAAEKTGFSLALPELENVVIRVMNDEMIEVIAKGEDEIRVRKAKGEDDISGDYNEYADVQNGEIATIKGNDGVFQVLLPHLLSTLQVL